MKMRAFIALELSPKLQPPLRKVIRQLNEMGSAIKSVNPDQLHLTLKFLGDINSDLVPEICKRLEGIASKNEPLNITLERLGLFPHIKRPLVIWAGVDLDHDQLLSQLAGSIDQSLLEIGFEKEERPFHPHVTLARIKRKPPESFFELIEAKGLENWGEYSCTEIHLIQSELSPSGSIYTKLESFSFG